MYQNPDQPNFEFCPKDGNKLVNEKCEVCGLERNNFQKKKWRRILFERQEYPDNYTDTSFLQSLDENEQPQLELLPLISRTSEIIINLSLNLSLYLFHLYLFSQPELKTLLWLFLIFYIAGNFVFIGFYKKA